MFSLHAPVDFPRHGRRIDLLALLSLALSPLVSCSGEGTDSTSGTGGAVDSGSGGLAPSTGGATAGSGGAPSSGGQSVTGGTLSSTGGAEAGGNGTGGSDDAAGGTATGGNGTGGAATGGASAEDDPVRSAGCGTERSLQNGRIDVGNRFYLLDVPEDYDSDHPYRVVFGFHWVGGTAEDVATGQTVPGNGTWAHYGLKELAEGSTIFVAPQGVGNGWGQGQGDLDFVDNILDGLKADLCIDESRVFANGFSFGGAMTYALACARSDDFRAVSVNNAGQISGCSGGTEPIAYQGVHGVRDGVFNMQTGRSLRDRFVENNGCTPQSAPEPAENSLAPHICTDYECPDNSYPLRWCAFDEGHIAAPQDGQNGDSGDTWVAVETWDFFTRF